MPFCPQCGYEYVAGVEQCADCLVSLVDEPAPEAGPGADFKWVPLPPFPGPIFAEMAKEALEQNDIPCLLKKDFLSSAYLTQGTSTLGLPTRLFVPEDRLAESEEIIREILGESDASDLSG